MEWYSCGQPHPVTGFICCRLKGHSGQHRAEFAGTTDTVQWNSSTTPLMSVPLEVTEEELIYDGVSK